MTLSPTALALSGYGILLVTALGILLLRSYWPPVQ